jgi:hypothetical protein
MIDDIVAAIFLLLTGVVALVVGFILLKEYLAKKTMHHLMWATAFLVLFVSGVLIILFGFDVLGNILIPPVAALIPVGLATGLLFVMYEDKPKIAWGFLGYEMIIIVAMLIMGIVAEETNSIMVMASHIPAGLAIFFLPFISGENKAWMFSIGGALISVGGMLLAMMKLTDSDFVLFQADFIFAVLSPLLLIVGAFFTLAVIYPEKWRVNVPVLSGMLLKE